MSPPMQLTSHMSVAYAPTSDVLDRHDYGISKNRKLASTGGGRAWSEDEVRMCRMDSRLVTQPEAAREGTANQVLLLLGSLSSPDSSPENAVQAYCRSSEENRAGLPSALPPVEPRKQPPQAHHFGLVQLIVRALSHPARRHPLADPGVLVPRLDPSRKCRKLRASLSRPGAAP